MCEFLIYKVAVDARIRFKDNRIVIERKQILKLLICQSSKEVANY